MPPTINAQIVTAIEKLSDKLDVLSKSVEVHHALGREECKKLDQLFEDIHGNGKLGLRRDVDDLQRWMGGSKRLTWIIATACVGSLAGAVITFVGNLR